MKSDTLLIGGSMNNTEDDNFFDNFTHSCAAARTLLRKAHEQGNLIEGLVLYASLIDAFLRNLIAIKTGSKRDGDVALDPRFFYHDEEHWFSERKIYTMARDAEIISEGEYAQLNELYVFRNRMIHRFILSDVAYADLAPRLVEYESIYQRLFKQLEELEAPQEMTSELRASIEKRIGTKIAGKWVRVEDVVESARRDGYLVECRTCKHLKLNHVHFDDAREQGMAVGRCWTKSCSCSDYVPGEEEGRA
jgi:hypothetical protein